MPDPSVDFTNFWKFAKGNWQNLIPVVFLAAFGGFISVMNSKEKPSIRRLITEISTAAFTGVMTFFFMLNFDLKWYVIGAGVGISGYAARPVLAVLERKLIDILNYGSTEGMNGRSKKRTMYKPDDTGDEE